VEKNSSLFFRKSICVRESKNSNRCASSSRARQSPSARGGKVHVTISAGLASFPDDSVDPDELFALADQRMFQAKAEGRNRVVASPTPVPIQTTAADPIPTLHS
jgi:diguanylate cyclase (GGDEF)-like protein